MQPNGFPGVRQHKSMIGKRVNVKKQAWVSPFGQHLSCKEMQRVKVEMNIRN